MNLYEDEEKELATFTWLNPEFDVSQKQEQTTPSHYELKHEGDAENNR
ncbi:MAG: hypothetical protein ACQEWU_09585 [Bacillota bacterium]|uniref:Uncharacterized protein n=1 Tax=Virgibacillus salarius TaxID=447199 RepID=A0A941E1U8_9BACI|nr:MULTISPECIES: hypothetical protein [Bacillaceae]NAZ10058.1 hypothetical protein [Agaribacter marinus]MBR7797348.1 hypothetical protein [Virgibacillus salarius]MCC2250834.1 hypothetical protein [Virgibacillus sp. AGTR]MDY7046326.1 hypothetical protein [Virgibacillus sp. M23]QRZ16491.1 hypothetical protein JUJ52_11735 [Virgibacillus sp. AGTR]